MEGTHKKVLDDLRLVLSPFFEHIIGEAELADIATNKERNAVIVDYDHVEAYAAENPQAHLSLIVQNEFYFVCDVLGDMLRQKIIDVHGADAAFSSNTRRPRQFAVRFTNLPIEVPRVRVADLGSDCHNKLRTVQGTVTRLNQPELLLKTATFVCKQCGNTIPDVAQEFQYKLPTICTNSACRAKSGFVLDATASTRVDFQRVLLQEPSTVVDPGTTPATIEAIMQGDLVGLLRPGQTCQFIGTVIVVPDLSVMKLPGEHGVLSIARGVDRGSGEGISGVKGVSATTELTFKYVFLVNNIEMGPDAKTVLTASSSDLDALQDALAKDMPRRDRFEAMRDPNSDQFVPTHTADFVRSFAPAIYGHTMIKKAIILMLLGGVTREDDMRIRGDINICIVGDPSTGKSQFLTFVKDFHPRAVFTSGKSASGAGITASVLQDPQTHEFAIVPGAMMLADNGVCCIDEMEKMDEIDQSALHEAMEQQTISISKAGLNVTYNSRASVLAAMNPVQGLYDPARTLRQNVRIAPALISRFDLFFVVRDECNPDNDRRISDHILNNHMPGADHTDDAEFAAGPSYTLDEIRDYITWARTVSVRISEEASNRIGERYIGLRRRQLENTSMRLDVTPRQLEALFRLSQACAKLYGSDTVTVEHVEEAYELLEQTIIHVNDQTTFQVPLVDLEELWDVEPDSDAGGEGAAALEDGEFGFGLERSRAPRQANRRARQETMSLDGATFERYRGLVNEFLTTRFMDETGGRQYATVDEIISHLLHVDAEAPNDQANVLSAASGEKRTRALLGIVQLMEKEQELYPEDGAAFGPDKRYSAMGVVR
ncbi:DNA replication licensing factor MCM6 [Carpediemonas membranifera]|uniref:DNA helicase n=1 Tax=Carpediemonas membranifera TaxID=201153 RepID=A0A8J6AU45_9EUKA|nr:DNA replication licensing factor MCM6 [Carpediemonas membranifera]|eukprot:KAG9392525.1 DNA replication licensing factor MCM6 [Carpediemonas membranifera]